MALFRPKFAPLLEGASDMGSFLIVVQKLSRIKDVDVGNLRKFEYFNTIIYRQSLTRENMIKLASENILDHK